MGNKWSTTAITGYKANSPTDDGAETAANQVNYRSITTNLTDPLNSSLTVVIASLNDLFSNGTVAKSGSYTTTTSDHTRLIQVTGSNTITLLAAATAGAGYSVTVKNSGTGLVTVSRDGTDTINGATSVTLAAGHAIQFVVNAAGDGYNFLSFGRDGTVPLSSQTASTSATLDFALDLTNYARHVIHIDNLKPATDGAELWGRVSSDGVTYASSAYRWSRHNLTDAATEGLAGDASDAKFLMANAVGNQDGEQVSGTIEIASVSGMGVRVSWRLSGENAAGSYYMINGMGAYVAAASTYFRLLFSSGNIASGTVRMYAFKA